MMITEDEISKAVIYGRKSREDADSLEGQIAACKQWAEAKGITDYDIFIDEGDASSEDWFRPEFQKMLKNINFGLYDAVIAVDQFRIGRTDDFSKFMDMLVENDCFFGSVEAGKFYDFENETDVMVSDVMTGIGKFQLSQIKKKLKRGTIQSAQKGNWLGKKAPVGYYYDRTTKRLKKSTNAFIIREMFELYMNGLSTNDIAFKFNHEENKKVEYIEKGIIKYMNWSSAGISRMLNNPVYVGHSLYGKTTQKKRTNEKGLKKRKTLKTNDSEQILVKNTHKGIVSSEEWDKVQALLKKRNSRSVALKIGKHTFSGFIHCSECKAVHSFQTSKGRKKRITTCQTRTYSDDLTSYTVCKNGGCNLDVFEDKFYAAFGERVKQLENYLDLIKNHDSNSLDHKMKKEALKVAKETKIKQLKKKADKITDNIEDCLYDDEKEALKKIEVKEIRIQIKELTEQIESYLEEQNDSELNQIEKIINNMKNFFTNKDNPLMTETEKNEILSEFIELIIYTKLDNEVHIKVIWKPEINDILEEN